MMSGPNSPNLNPLEYQAWGNAGVLTKAATEANTSSQVLKCTKIIWSALPEKAIDNAVKDHHKRLQVCVSANDGHFEHLMS